MKASIKDGNRVVLHPAINRLCHVIAFTLALLLLEAVAGAIWRFVVDAPPGTPLPNTLLALIVGVFLALGNDSEISVRMEVH